MREVTHLLPTEHLIYLGDSGHLPYGNKSKETIIRFSIENASFLLKKKIKLLIVACHTASALALEEIQKKLPIPVVGVATCSIPDLLQARKEGGVAILGTAATIASGVHAELIQKQNPKIKIHPIACPLFVPFIEEGLLNHPATELIVRHYLDPLKNHPIDAILLGCTHYPLLRSLIQKVVGDQVTLIEPALACARETKKILSQKKLANPTIQPPHYEFYATDNPLQFKHLASSFFGTDIGDVKMKLLSS